MTEKPDYVKAFQKPAKTEIKHIGGGWYLYECSSKYDPAIKRSRKISGKCLGVITPQGLVKTMRRLRPICEAAAKSVVIDDVYTSGDRSFSGNARLSCANDSVVISRIYGRRFMQQCCCVPNGSRRSRDCRCILSQACWPACSPICRLDRQKMQLCSGVSVSIAKR